MVFSMFDEEHFMMNIQYDRKTSLVWSNETSSILQSSVRREIRMYEQQIHGSSRRSNEYHWVSV